WKLANDICSSVAPFTDDALTPESLTFIETPSSDRPDSQSDVAIAPELASPVVTIPMVFCGELVGGLGVLSTNEISLEHRAILQLIAYQLAASIRNAHAFAAAESASLLDELTGAYNRRYLKRALSAEWRRAERYRNDLSFVMVDVDNFKRINDVYGHLA